MSYKAAVITVSSTRSENDDTSGEAVIDLLKTHGYIIAVSFIVKDDIADIADKLKYCSDKLKLDLIVTTGGTGLGPYDVTPEATISLSERRVDGIPELIRRTGLKFTENAVLSRGIAVVRRNSLIINLPGSPVGACQSLEAVINIIPHAIRMIAGEGH